MVFKTDYRLMQVKSIAECSNGSILILLTCIKLPFVIKAPVLSRENSAILLTCIKLPFVIKAFVLSIFEKPLKVLL